MIEAEFEQAMRKAGVFCNDPIIADGALHRFSPNGKGETDGWYVLHNQGGAFGNWRKNIHEKWSANNPGLSPFELKRVNEQIAEEKRKHEQEILNQYEEVSKKVTDWWSKLSLTGHSSYLETKQIKPWGIRFGKDAIAVPLQDIDGKLWSLQRIYHNGDKFFEKGGRKKGCFCSIGSIEESQILYVCEGYATGASIYEATQVPTIIAFDVGNLEPVVAALLHKWPQKKITICADNDQWKEKNVGVETAKATSKKHACNIVWPEFPNEAKINGKDPTDFNDLHALQGLETIKKQIEKCSSTPSRSSLPSGFFQTKAGLHFSHKEDDIQWICSPIEVLAYTRDEHNENWGRLVLFKDLDGFLHTKAISMESLKGDCTDFFGLLLSCGLRITPKRNVKIKLAEFVQNSELTKKVTCTTRIGWHGDCFVLPDFCIPTRDEIYLQSDNSYFASIHSKGTLEEWQEATAKPCQGNSRLVFALSCAFAAPLLPLLHRESGGFNLKGASSIGKSTALAVAASVWGSPKHIQQWRATGNALEAVAEAHNHALLCLDELGQVGGTEAGEIVYMLANGSGKNRLKAKGGLRKKFEWSIVVLSTGEVSIEDKLNEAGKKAHAGILTRMIDIPADAGQGYRLFDTIHGFKDGNALANHLKEQVTFYYGSAIREYLSHLVDFKANLISFIDKVEDDFFSRYVPKEADGLVKRVASRFALVAAAGKIATQFRILPFTHHETFEAAALCFQAWLDERGGTGSHEEEEAIKQVQAFIETHHSCRFQLIGDSYAETDKIINQAGYKRKTLDGKFEFLIFPHTFEKEICKGHNIKLVKKALADRGLLILDSNRKYTKTVRVPQLNASKRFIVLASTILVDSETSVEVGT